MTSIEKSASAMPKSAKDYITEIQTIIGKEFPIVIRVTTNGTMIYCKYETTWNSGAIKTAQKAESLTAQEITTINTWRDSYIT